MIIYRRTFFIGLSASVAVIPLLGCSTWSPTCDQNSSELERSACRQREIRENAPAYLTLGMMIGAALGAGFAVALRQNPIAGAAIGAALGGATTIAERYLAYRLEQAAYDRAKAMQDIRRDIDDDHKRFHSIAEDLQVTLRETRAAINDNSRKLSEQTETLHNTKLIYTDTRINQTWATTVLDTYKQVKKSNRIEYRHLGF